MKQDKSTQKLNSKADKIIKVIKIKLCLFFIISFIIIVASLFYITCFCGIYINTQMHLIKDSIISFAFSLIYPLGLYIFPCICRISALRAKKKDKEYLYKLSKLIAM